MRAARGDVTAHAPDAPSPTLHYAPEQELFVYSGT